MSEKKLMLYPIASLIICGIIFASFIIPFYLFMMPVENYYLVIILFFVVYVILTFVGILFNAAIVAYSAEKFRGRTPDFGEGLSIALSKSTKLLGWALIAATVGVLIRLVKGLLRRKFGTAGRLAGGLLGMAWTYVTFFILPVLLLEKEGVISSVKNSASLFKQTWGETITGRIGFGIIFLLFGLLGIGIFIIALFAGVPILIVLVLLVIYILVIFALYSAMKSVFVTALYHFAREGRLPGPYSSDMIPNPQGTASAAGTGGSGMGYSSSGGYGSSGGGSMGNRPSGPGHASQSGQSDGSLDNMEGVEVYDPGQSSTSNDRSRGSQNRKAYSPAPPPPAPQQEGSRTCPDCGKDLRHLENSGRWYCDNCYQYK